MDKDPADLENFKTALGLHVEDPWERVKIIFLRNKFGEWHPDFQNALESAELGFLGGAVIGGYINQREYLMKIKERSDANVYHDRMDAYRQMSQESMKGFLKGAFRWGPKVSVFVGGFFLFGSCVEAYRNKSGIIEYSLGGSMVGGLLRFNFGVRGILVGTLVGSVLGTIYGIGHLGLIKMTKSDGIQLKYAQYSFSRYLEEQKLAAKMKGNKEEFPKASQPPSSNFLGPLNNVSIATKEQEKVDLQ